MILKPRKNDGMHLRRGKAASTYEGALGAARKIWWDTQNANAALKALDRRPRGVEGHLLYGLKINGPNDLVNALERVSNFSDVLHTKNRFGEKIFPNF